ncbi:aminotransferase class V-fold PLP-dependent enzyme [Bacteroidota bacterium]
MSFNINKIREDFPILSTQVHGKPLIYFDNGATTQKPKPVIDTINDFHSLKNGTIHRGIHHLSEQATNEYEKAREIVKKFVNAKSTKEIIFTSGTTGSINGLAFSFGEKYIKEGDEIIISEMEHHANIVPWQMLCERKNAKLKIIPFDDTGDLILDEFEKLISDRTRLVAITHVSNILGTINPIRKIISKAHENDIPVMIDAAQSIQHSNIDVQELNCDFLVFSAHKLYGPTGIGVLYGKENLLEELPPFQGGGDMVDKVTFEKTTYNELPYKFEAGTTNYIGAIGMAKAIEYLQKIGFNEIQEYENELFGYASNKFNSIDGLTIYGTSKKKIGIFSFLMENIHYMDAGMVLDKLGIAVRTGTHCGQPVIQHYRIDGTIRASIVFYNTKEEIDIFCEALNKVRQMFS